MLERCKDMVKWSWEIKIIDIYKEKNKVADAFTKQSIMHARGFGVLECPPIPIHQLNKKSLGAINTRTISSQF